MNVARKRKYYAKECEKLSVPGANRISYKALRNVADAERKKPWTVQSLQPNLTDKQIAEDLADFFAGISQTFPPLDCSSLPRTFDRPMHLLTECEVMERLRSMKKPSSAVPIDPPPLTINKHTQIYASISTPILNDVLQGRQWPSPWSSEEVSVIPKIDSPASYNDCRNISCMSIFS